MHMADALISPAVGGALWAVSAGTAVFCAKKLREEADERKIPLMGVLGAFIFSAQMINFSIPGTGSSGHLGGGMILAILLGPYAAFLTISSILTVQSLFFADGGLLALGCNIFNIGFIPCFLVLPLVYRPIVGRHPTARRLLTGATLSGIVALQFGALCVVLQTVFSGVSELPFAAFTLLMLPIHLAIGIVEGLVTFGVVSIVWKARPEVVEFQNCSTVASSRPKLLVGLAVVTLCTAGLVSWLASAQPDGLEWSISKVAEQDELSPPERGLAATAAKFQSKTAFLPDYDFAHAGAEFDQDAAVVNPGTSVAGLVGAGLTLTLIMLIAGGLRWRQTAN